MKRLSFFLLLVSLFPSTILASGNEGAKVISFFGYDGCIELSNATTRVVLEPNCGGRVIDYSVNGKNVIYRDPTQAGWTYSTGKQTIDICGGRFDIGPEMAGIPRIELWVGKWTAQITGARRARMISPKDSRNDIQLIRDFELDKDSSYLKCKQTIINKGNTVVHVCHWSRTLAEGGGICEVPLTPNSRFPKGYIYYGPGAVMNYSPDDDPSIRVREGFLELLDTPPQPKFGIDSYAGWLGYISKNDLLFVKRFPVYPDRVYNEAAAFTISLWYFKRERCELEPIGPREILKPGQKASFTEEWWLFPYKYPSGGENVNLPELKNFVAENTR